ncbi:MAG: phage holin family protein [Opitutaceae bacterium]|jgi:putative membrane protein
MNSSLFHQILRWIVMALGVAIAARLVPGISYDDGTALLVAVLLLSFCNTVLRPLLLLFTFPFIVISLGLGVLVINALLFLLVGRLVEGFHVAGFWPALGGSLIVSITSMLLSGTIGKPRSKGPPSPPLSDTKGGDVIDI